MQGLLAGYTESGALVSPISGTTELGRDQQQIIILYAAYRIVLASLRSLSTSFRAKAGSVEFETAQSATILRDVLAALRDKIKLVLALSDTLGATDTAYIDAVFERTTSLALGDTWFVR